ncbi:cytochrome c peroxidase [Pelomonas saccharophila]|uniref:Cytochrome c peroxidase n=1 Tax=Roseateles saccharophilus TaxID=304 RepID=A0ABU1YR70_ROSSA|nr:cytochrome c peroxidase [Roseateles saccharophilus]MDR7271353.1 cytochrome c peroxidase [Roseateles saccharophilus]
MPMRHALLPALLICLLAGCGGGSGGATATAADDDASADAAALRRPPQPAPAPAPAPVPTLAQVGDRLFEETSLSASGKLACANCHVEARGHADAAGSFLPLGGTDGTHQGLRSSPSARYLDQAGAFGFDAQGRPRGGLFWDGRANNRTEQARGPLFNPDEMANADVGALAAKLRALPYAADLRAAANLPAAATDDQLVDAAVTAIARYQADDASFHPFTSKFDAVQDGRASFTAQEQRGLNLFNDPQRGNCASCHSSRPAPGLNRALFTDFSYHALAVPRNQSRATANPAFFDLGLCARSDLAGRADLCGLFRTPTLRNVALTGPYFHNARFASLEDVVAFYATRDIDPARWYPNVNGQVQLYNDLPAAYRSNVQQGAPFRRAGQPPALNAQDVADVVAFLRTLSDGFTTAPAAQ